MYHQMFDLAFVIHFFDGDTIHGIWNSEEGIWQGNKMKFSELCEVKDVSSIELLLKDRTTKTINRNVLSVQKQGEKIRYVMLFRGRVGGGFGSIKLEHYENAKEINPRLVCIPGAIQMSIVALKVIDEVKRTPLDAFKTYPIVAKAHIDHCGIFERDI